MSAVWLQLSRLEGNQSVWEDDPSDEDYMLVDDLQKLTDEFVTEVNSTLTPKPLWRPFVELIFKDIANLDLNGKDKVLVGDLDYLKEVALMLTLAEEKELGEPFSNLVIYIEDRLFYLRVNLLFQRLSFGG